MGRQSIAFRGHHDQGNLTDKHNLNKIKISSSVVNEGNFRELLRFRVGSGDDCLKNHLLTAHSKATYISHTIQYQLIKCCKEEILTIILKDVKKSQYYSIILDETTDIDISMKKIKFWNDLSDFWIVMINLMIMQMLTKNFK